MIDAMHEDEARLNILKPDMEPRATDYIGGMHDMIQSLIDKGYAYAPGNGDVYYRVGKRQAGRAQLGIAVGSGPSGLAHRMLGDVHLLPGRDVRHSWWRQRSGIPTPRKRNRPKRSGHRQDLRQRLDALRHDPHQWREDVQVLEQLLHHSGRAG
nr:cysteinyl-tRNA synthetase [Tanacetum cinerariifolium]